MCYSQSVVCRTWTLFDDELPDVSITPSVHPAASSLLPLSFMRFLFLGVSWSSFWSWHWVLRDSCRSHPGEESHLLLFFKFSIHLNNTCFSVTLKFGCLFRTKVLRILLKRLRLISSALFEPRYFFFPDAFQDDSVALSSLFLYKHWSGHLFTVQTSKLSTQLLTSTCLN